MIAFENKRVEVAHILIFESVARLGEVGKMSEEEEKAVLKGPCRGTWTIYLIFIILFGIAWLYMYFGVFLSHGPVS